MFRFPVAPILLGYILGPLVEENFRRTLFISDGDFMAFVSSPVSIICLALVVLALVGPVVLAIKRRRLTTVSS